MQIETKKIRRMKTLMNRLLDKSFSADDKEELSTLSAHFLFVSKAIDYTGGYTLTNTKEE